MPWLCKAKAHILVHIILCIYHEENHSPQQQTPNKHTQHVGTQNRYPRLLNQITIIEKRNHLRPPSLCCGQEDLI